MLCGLVSSDAVTLRGAAAMRAVLLRFFESSGNFNVANRCGNRCHLVSWSSP